MPENSIYVGRPTIFGNPFTGENAAQLYREALFDLSKCPLHAQKHMRRIRDRHRDLVGKNLVCWCPTNVQCHADALIELITNTHAPDGVGDKLPF